MSGSVSGGKNKESSVQGVTGNSSSTSRPLAPEGWEDAWRGMQLSASGFTPAQQQGLDWMSGALQNGDASGLGTLRTQMGGAADYWKDAADNRPSNTLATLATRYPDQYRALQDVTVDRVAARDVAAPQEISADQVSSRDIAGRDVTAQAIAGRTVGARDVAAQDAASRDVNSQRGASFMDDYNNPYMRDVVDASLADYDAEAAEARNAFRAANAGAFGNKRTGVAEGQLAADAAVGRAKLAADLRAGGFNSAAAFGMQDADRKLAGDQANQSAALQAALANAANRLGADQFNSQQSLAAQQFNAESGTAADRFNAEQAFAAQQANAAQQLSAQQANAANDLAARQTNAANTLAARQFNASNDLDTRRFNATNDMGAQQFNASNALDARKFNNQLQNEREMFDVDAGYRGYEMRDNARRAYESNLGAQAGLAGQGYQMNADLAQNLIGAGGIGQGQNLAWLAAGTPLFGEQTNGSQSGTTTTNGRSSSKGGGLGFG